MARRLLFSATLFFGAALLCGVQPMVGRLLLPLLGGAPRVWNTCLVFFQAALLGGYLWAHRIGSLRHRRTQVVAHMLLVAGAAVSLPIALPAIAAAPPTGDPTLWLLAVLALTVGLPFAAVAATGPLLQRWYSLTDADDAGDPYHLYAASNLGSAAGLLAYPFALEPFLGTRQQSLGWTLGFAALAALVASCGVAMLTAGPRTPRVDPPTTAPSSPSRRLRWLLLAALPSSLLLGVTTHISTDIAAVPLLWIVPLGLYLLTWVVAFARRQRLPAQLTARILPIALVAWLLLRLTEATEPGGLIIAVHLLTFTLAALVCHQRLALARPAAGELTRFYLLVSLGGVLGGAFNALVAPLLFPDLWEYPIAIVAAVGLSGGLRGVGARSLLVRDLAAAAAVALLAVVLLGLAAMVGIGPGPLHRIVVFGLPVLATYLTVSRPTRLAFAAGALLLVGALTPGSQGDPMYVERNFFGVQRVTVDPSGRFHQIVHGHTLHGRQWIAPERATEPLAYYHRGGPFGDVIRARRALGPTREVAVVGLGAGAMACYGLAGERWRFFEIDPAVVAIAHTPRLFSFLQHCGAAIGGPEVIPGDARLTLSALPRDDRVDLLAIDAFSSDAIPVHLLTREAMALYFSRLRPGGVLAVHASNRYLDVVAVLAALAHDAGLAVRARDDLRGAARSPGAEPSRWVAIARSDTDLGALTEDPRWRLPRPHDRVWTDDYNDLPRLLLSSLGGPG